MRLLPPAVLLLTITASVVRCDTLPPTTSLLQGELRLEGKVQAIEADRLTIRAGAFTNQNGKRGTIDPPKTKIILLPPTGAPTNLKIGQSIVVTGRDGGAGKPLVAREIVSLAEVEADPSTPPAVPDTRPKPGTQTQVEPLRPPTGPKVLEFRGGLPPGWKAGNLNVRVEKAGFDYPTRFLPTNFLALEKTPVFYCIFQIRGQLPPGDIREHLNVRRLLGPRSEFVRPSSINFRTLDTQGDAARVVFWDSRVDPTWQFVDMDLDTIFDDDSAGKTSTELVLENVPLPTEGEVPVQGEATSALGTRYQVLKIKANGKGQWKLVVAHQLPATPRDLEISSYSYQSDIGGGGGGLIRGNAPQGEDELFLSASLAQAQIKRIALRFYEASNSTQKRGGVSRQRIRFPLRDLLQQSPPALPDKPLPILAQTTEGPVTARIESQGLTWGNDGMGALVFLRGTPDDTKRGIQWTVQKGSLRVPGQTSASNVPPLTPDFSSLWHVDATPKADDETVGLVLFTTNEGAARGDAEFQLEGRTQLSTPFEKTVAIPSANGVVPVDDKDDEPTLLLRKIQKFSRPDEMANFPDWIRGNWHRGGLALVFEANPLLGDAEFIPYCVDAEDDQGRPLQRGILYHDVLYKVDVTDKGPNQNYTLLLGEPAPDAKFVKVWLSTNERSQTVRKQTIQIKDMLLDRNK